MSSLRTPSIVAGSSLAAMAVIAPVVTFGLIDSGDPALVPFAVLGFAAIAVLDVVVASALYEVFAPAGASLARLAAWLRLAYAAVLLAATSALASGTPEGLADFHRTWDVALLVFGAHLVLIGWLAVRATYVWSPIGWLLVIAGLGYGVDSVVAVLVPGTTFSIAVVTFVGELALIVWLLARGRTITTAPVVD